MTDFFINFIQGYLFGSIRDNIIITTLTVSLMGFTTLLVHSFFYRYLLAKNFIFVSFMLPTMVLLVTKVIATNLYLSLGMIGALSIVRYRTPVKSQYELTFYFALICLGIIIGVNVGYAFLAYMFLIISPILYQVINNVFIKLKFEKVPDTDIEECNLNILVENENLNDFINKYGIKRYIKRIDSNAENNRISINLNLENMNSALALKEQLDNNNNIKSINVSKY
jgi:hypothetical protein